MSRIFSPKEIGLSSPASSLEVAANLAALPTRQSPLRLSLNSLYELIEKTLVDNNAYMSRSASLLNRSHKLAFGWRTDRHGPRDSPQPSDRPVQRAENRDRGPQSFSLAPTRFQRRARNHQGGSDSVLSSKQSFVHIEEIQDIVQEELMKSGQFKVAEQYILYRALRNSARAEGSSDSTAPMAPTVETG